MSVSSIKRFVRKSHWLIRYVAILIGGVFVVTMATWTCSTYYMSYSMRIWPEMTHHQLSQYNEVPTQEAPQLVCPPCPTMSPQQATPPPPAVAPPTDLHVINCTINDVDLLSCRRDHNEVYMPVTFINEFFEVYGSIRRKGKQEYYDFQYAYGKIYPPQAIYHPGSVFLNFHKYNVEGRAAIMCVTASDGVPLANQWNPEGYYYAISVAQYGLSHHAKGIIEGNPEPKLISSGRQDVSMWQLSATSVSIGIVEETLGNGRTLPVVAFTAPESVSSPGPVLKLNTKEQALCLDIRLEGPGGLTVKIMTREGKLGYVHFNYDDTYMVTEGNHVTYGIGQRNMGKWMHLARDLHVDWLKSLGAVKYNSPTNFQEIIDVTLHGKGFLDNLTISTSAHNDHLIHAADWLVNNQDSKGGWPTATGMKTGDNISLKPGWYSAMGQGQAMSTLVRAYNLTGHRHYLEVATRALHLYELSSEEGGVRARFLGQLDWYEEYPTTPTSTFVLNGFIFAMLGLYDVMMTAEGESQRLAEKLWKSGLHSLKIMLGMYDSGTGTLYDLRHVINHEQPNRARWDYHTTHIALIQEMAIIDGDPIFHSTAARWIDYFYGKWSKHN